VAGSTQLSRGWARPGKGDLFSRMEGGKSTQKPRLPRECTPESVGQVLQTAKEKKADRLTNAKKMKEGCWRRRGVRRNPNWCCPESGWGGRGGGAWGGVFEKRKGRSKRKVDGRHRKIGRANLEKRAKERQRAGGIWGGGGTWVNAPRFFFSSGGSTREKREVPPTHVGYPPNYIET